MIREPRNIIIVLYANRVLRDKFLEKKNELKRIRKEEM